MYTPGFHRVQLVLCGHPTEGLEPWMQILGLVFKTPSPFKEKSGDTSPGSFLLCLF